MDDLQFAKLMGSPEGGVFLAERLLRVRDRYGRLRALRANAVQRAFEARRERSNIVLKARQMGLTTWVAGRFFLKTVLTPGTMTVQVAHTREAAEAIFAMVGRMWEHLPDPLREGPMRRTRANAGQMVFGEIDSEFRVLSAADANAGRGLTIQNLHLSEVSRWPAEASATLAGLRAALTPEGELVMESTPCGAYGPFYEEWQSSAETGLVRHFFPWWLEPAYQSAAAAGALTAEEQALVEGHGLTRKQIGFRRGLERSYRGLRVQEFAEDAVSCFKATGECCFGAERVEARLRELPRPLEQRRGGALLIWLPPLAGNEYLLGVDTAGGGADGDFAAAQVIDRKTGMQCAELRERLTPVELARAAAALAREYGNAEIAVERNNHGAAVLACLELGERYRRVYEQGGVAGWLTSAGSKPGMIGRMEALLEEAPEMFFSERLLGECRTFVRLAGGATGAANAAHDDCLMAMAVAQAVRAERLA